jgi:hypothetical protein
MRLRPRAAGTDIHASGKMRPGETRAAAEVSSAPTEVAAAAAAEVASPAAEVASPAAEVASPATTMTAPASAATRECGIGHDRGRECKEERQGFPGHGGLFQIAKPAWTSMCSSSSARSVEASEEILARFMVTHGVEIARPARGERVATRRGGRR